MSRDQTVTGIVGALFVGFAASAWLGLVPKQISAGDRTVL
jgi:hypothetical protein